MVSSQSAANELCRSDNLVSSLAVRASSPSTACLGSWDILWYLGTQPKRHQSVIRSKNAVKIGRSHLTLVRAENLAAMPHLLLLVSLHPQCQNFSMSYCLSSRSSRLKCRNKSRTSSTLTRSGKGLSVSAVRISVSPKHTETTGIRAFVATAPFALPAALVVQSFVAINPCNP